MGDRYFPLTRARAMKVKAVRCPGYLWLGRSGRCIPSQGNIIQRQRQATLTREKFNHFQAIDFYSPTRRAALRCVCCTMLSKHAEESFFPCTLCYQCVCVRAFVTFRCAQIRKLGVFHPAASVVGEGVIFSSSGKLYDNGI